MHWYWGVALPGPQLRLMHWSSRKCKYWMKKVEVSAHILVSLYSPMHIVSYTRPPHAALQWLLQQWYAHIIDWLISFYLYIQVYWLKTGEVHQNTSLTAIKCTIWTSLKRLVWYQSSHPRESGTLATGLVTYSLELSMHGCTMSSKVWICQYTKGGQCCCWKLSSPVNALE